MTLYEIKTEIEKLVDDETGEIVDFEQFAGLQLARDEKLENVACYIKNLKSDIAAYKEEKAEFERRIRRDERKIESLENLLMNELQGEKFKTQKVECSFRKSTAVRIDDSAAIPGEWFRQPDPVIDKAGIKAALKSGQEIAGASLEERKSIIVK